MVLGLIPTVSRRPPRDEITSVAVAMVTSWSAGSPQKSLFHRALVKRAENSLHQSKRELFSFSEVGSAGGG